MKFVNKKMKALAICFCILTIIVVLIILIIYNNRNKALECTKVNTDFVLCENVVIAESVEPLSYPITDDLRKPGELNFSDNLKKAMKLYQNQDQIMFRVLVGFSIYEEATWESQINQRLDFATKNGAQNIISATSSIDYFFAIDAKGVYFMELSANAILELSDKYACSFTLAIPPRVDGYDSNITDLLTSKLSRMKNKETIKIIMVSTVDNENSESGYNSRYTKKWPGSELYYELLEKSFTGSWETDEEKRNDLDSLEYEIRNLRKKLNDATVDNYINEIISRNKITKKIIKNYFNVSISNNVFDITARFEAELTKKDIIRLAKDSEVKLISQIT